MGPIIGIAAAVGVVIGGFKLLYDAYTADATAAEQANQAAKDLTQAYNDARTASDNLANSIDKYHTAVKDLEDLTHGTDD